MRSLYVVLGAVAIAATMTTPVLGGFYNPPPPASNCKIYGSYNGPYCKPWETCCGAGTYSPLCIGSYSGKSCCIHYKSATACGQTQTCCGSGGPGYSSNAFCCDQGSTCCRAADPTKVATCCGTGAKCCAGANAGFCCPAHKECDLQSNTCKLPTTPAPTPAQVTTLPPPPAPTPAPTAGPAHHLCLAFSVPGGNTVFYSIVADGLQTELTRHDMSTNPPTLLDVTLYGALAMPNPPGSNFGDGVAYAAAMQNLNVWPTTAPTTAGSWDLLGLDGDRWRFQTQLNGGPFELTFATENCQTQTAAPTPAQVTTAAPPPAPTPASYPYHVCLSFSVAGGNTVLYSIFTGPTQTEMKRYDRSTNPPTLMDVNLYGPLSPPSPPGSHWGAGVAFAAEMHNRNAWPTTAPTTAGHWDVLGGAGDRWRFQTSLNGGPFELTFATADCFPGL